MSKLMHTDFILFENLTYDEATKKLIQLGELFEDHPLQFFMKGKAGDTGWDLVVIYTPLVKVFCDYLSKKDSDNPFVKE